MFHRILSRFQLLSWSLDLLEQNSELRKPDFPVEENVKRCRYPSRVMRYWWAACAIQGESRRLGKPPIIVDIGCERGMLKRMTPCVPGSRWIGLDKKSERGLLALAGYDETLSCNLEERIPLPDASADIVVCLHVLEHMAGLENAIKELVRILRPGGILLIGAPVLPHILSLIREWQFRGHFKKGTRESGAHVHSFCPAILRELTESFGLDIEFMVGLRFLRWSGSMMENSRTWVRLNQIWGALFPALGREIAIQCRVARPLPGVVPVTTGFASL